MLNDGGFLVFLLTSFKKYRDSTGTDHNIYRGLSLHARKAQQGST
jgi:hypothetical protein